MKFLPIIVLVLVAVFLRVYNADQLFQYDHEQDLQAWIVKDILVSHHPRLIGQETSITGVFIGPLYYYSLAFFFAVFNLSPLSSVVLTTIISVATLLSIYFVFSKLFNKRVGLIGAFIYATSLVFVTLDRWAVPTMPTLLWGIWFLYVLFTFAKGNFSTTPILVILVALIWHIHIAFIPLLGLLVIAFFMGRKKFDVKQIAKRNLIISLFVAFLLVTPFIAFELRHNFSQTQSIFKATYQENNAIAGIERVQVVMQNLDRTFLEPMVLGLKLPFVTILFVGLIGLLWKIEVLSKDELILILIWIADVFFSQVLSKRPLTEYYFNNLLIVSLLIFSLSIAFLSKFKRVRIPLYIVAFLFMTYSFYFLMTKPNPVDGYVQKNDVVKFIAADVEKNSYPCVGINYIGGVEVKYGYRYLFWKNKVNLVNPSDKVPVYSLVNPASLSGNEIAYSSGILGIIVPNYKSEDSTVCTDPNNQLLPPNGFVN